MSRERIPVPYSDLIISVDDEAGHGGSPHLYSVSNEPSDTTMAAAKVGEVHFQEGPPQENGINGVTNETLLMIVAHRLKSFQSGPYVSEDNRVALEYIEKATEALFNRTKDRLSRGVEGTHQL